MSDKRYPPGWQDPDPAREPPRAHLDLRKLTLKMLDPYHVDDCGEYRAGALADALTAAVCERIAAGLEDWADKALEERGQVALRLAATRIRAGEWTSEKAP